MIEDLDRLFQRDLNKLRDEILQYPNDNSLWLVTRDIPNSGGNLCLHMCGNLRFFIGNVLGGSNYKRERDHEFEGTGYSKNQLLEGIDLCQKELAVAFDLLNDRDLQELYPLKFREEPISTTQFLLHLYGHFNYHLGQLNYHRRGIVG